MSEICTTCGLPQELCVCETIAKESLTIKIYTIKKKFGKKYTVIEGITDKDINLKDVTKKLKNTFACGGTAKDGVIELQGAHTQRSKEVLVTMGFAPESIEVKQ
ncbi:stress response translation initiation inhibitor YciH [Candidatus Woesearchaeota archaeon]|nr:MAG: stress response translation initiation inhibitor YciH [Candidatus Woesearchaeota archaeon]